MIFRKRVFLLMVVCGLVYGTEVEYVDIPCSAYKEGSVWTEKTTMSQGSSSDTTSIVKVNKDSKILLFSTTKTKMNNMVSQYKILTKMIDKNGTIYIQEVETEASGMKIKTKNIPIVPICGKVPRSFRYKTVSDTSIQGMAMPEMQYTKKVKRIGNKKIKTKLGEYETIVFQESIKIDVLGMENAVTTRMISIVYRENALGIIKQDTTTIAEFPPKLMTMNSGKMPSKIKTTFAMEMTSIDNK